MHRTVEILLGALWQKYQQLYDQVALLCSQQIDKKMEDALRHTVKRSLQELSRTLNGDNKTEVVPVFTVAINLGKTNRVELKPTVQVWLLAVAACCICSL